MTAPVSTTLVLHDAYRILNSHRFKFALDGDTAPTPGPGPGALEFRTDIEASKGLYFWDSNDEVLVWKGELSFAAGDRAPENVVVKASMLSTGVARLVHEAKVYDTLRSLQGLHIPRLVGLFKRSDTIDLRRFEPRAVLLLQDCGDAFESWQDIYTQNFDIR